MGAAATQGCSCHGIFSHRTVAPTIATKPPATRGVPVLLLLLLSPPYCLPVAPCTVATIPALARIRERCPPARHDGRPRLVLVEPLEPDRAPPKHAYQDRPCLVVRHHPRLLHRLRGGIRCVQLFCFPHRIQKNVEAQHGGTRGAAQRQRRRVPQHVRPPPLPMPLPSSPRSPTPVRRESPPRP